MSLPQNKGLDSLMSKLKEAKKEIDEQSVKYNAGNISYADLEVIAAKVAVQDLWLNEKVCMFTCVSVGQTCALCPLQSFSGNNCKGHLLSYNFVVVAPGIPVVTLYSFCVTS